MSKDCIFCNIVKGTAEASVVYNDEDFIAFMDLSPINEGHILVVPKVHQEFVEEMYPALAGEMFILGKSIYQAILKTKLKCEGANFFLSNGEVAGQEVPHVHLHIAPRFKGDGVKLSAGRFLTKTRQELDQQAKEIKSFL